MADNPAAVVVVEEVGEVNKLTEEIQSVNLINDEGDVSVIQVDDPDVILPAQDVSVLVVDGDVLPDIQTYRSAYSAQGIYVGIAPIGASESDPVWNIYLLDETADHARRVPDPYGKFRWTDRGSLTYVEG